MNTLFKINQFLFLMLGLLFFGCKEMPSQKKMQASKIALDTIVDEVEILPETIEYFSKLGFEADDGRFLRYFCEGERLFIEYGNKDFRRVMQDTFYCDEFYNGRPRLLWENEEIIALRYGCGSPCWGIFILPLDENETEESFMYHYDFDAEKNILVYLGFDDATDKDYIFVRNLITKDEQRFEIEDCGPAFIGYCIDSLSLNNRNLYIRSKTKEEMDVGFSEKGTNIYRQKIKI